MQRIVNVPLGVVIARDRVDSPWQDTQWRVVSVFLDAPPLEGWRVLREDGQTTLYHAATLDLELHRKETAGYRANLDTGEPSVYVILREGSADGGTDPMHVHLLTASAHDVEAYGHLGTEIIGQVTMPEPLVELLAAFIGAHHVEEAFKKRRRKPYVREEEHQFGQEPIHVLRERMKKAGESKE